MSRRFSHDLRNPLNGISTANEALRESSSTHGADSEVFAQLIADSVEESVTLVDRLGIILSATADPESPQPVEMGGIVAKTLSQLEPRISQAGAKVASARRWPTVAGVPEWIILIWENLVKNSLRHGGVKPRLELGCDSTGGEHRFWLRDSGRGVAPEKRLRLFHPLERLHELNAPRGYGLPIIRRLIELQGGRCGYEPESASGGYFFFTLPAA